MPKRLLTELEWCQVFVARCKSKKGETLSDVQRELVDAAYKADRKRYRGMERAVFNATAPFGSTRRA
jgi:hypothetical protein